MSYLNDRYRNIISIGGSMRSVLCFLWLISLVVTSWSQMVVRNDQDEKLFKVTDAGKVGISIGETAPAATLDIGGDLKIGTVTTEPNSDDIAVLVLDAGIVKQRMLGADIWDGDDTGSGGDGVVTAASFSGTSEKTLTLTRSGGLNDLSASFTDRYEPNTDNQQLQISGRTLTIDRGNSLTLLDDRPLAGTQITVNNRTVSHANTSDQASMDNSGRTVIQDVLLDDNGHITTLRTVTLSDATEDDQPLSEVLSDGHNAGGHDAVNFGAIAIGGSSTNGNALMVNGLVSVSESQHIHKNLTVSWAGVPDPISGVYIGTDSQPTVPVQGDIYKLSVNGPTYVHGGIRACFEGGSKMGLGVPNPTSPLAIANLPSGSEMNITADNTGNLYRDTSSRRYKENIQTLQDEFDKILELEPITFAYKDSQLKSFGYIAEDLDALELENLVIYNQSGQPESIRYDKLSVYLLEVVKNLNSRIKQLESN